MSTVSAVQFFERELPRYFREGKARTKRRADVIFEVAGTTGGRWRLRLGNPPEVSALSSHDETADLLIRMDEAEFSEFLDGTLDVARAVHEGRLVLAGDLSLVDDLGTMWSTPRSWLSLRVEESDQ